MLLLKYTNTAVTYYILRLCAGSFGTLPRYPTSGVSQHCIHAIDICNASSVGCLLAWSADHASRQPTELIHLVVLRQVQSLFQSELSTKSDPELPLSNESIFSFP